MPTLYDFKGNPVKTSSLRTSQAAPTVAGVRSWANLAPGRGLSASRLAISLRNAAQGDIESQALIFEDMEEKDLHIFAEVSKRKRCISGLPWSVLPADDAAKSADIAGFVQRVLDKLSVPDLLFDLLDGLGKGVSALELTYDLSAGLAVPVSWAHTPLAWLQYTQEGELRIRDGSREGVLFAPYKWLVHRHKARSGGPYRDALYRVLAWPYLFRNYATAAWAQYVEGYGIPLRLGRYPAGAPDADKEKLLEAVSAIASEAAVVIPEGMDIQILEQSIKGGNNAHKALLDWSAGEISKAVLGATLSSASDGKGSYALGQVHNEVRRDIQESDARQLSSAIEAQLIRPIVDLNFGAQDAYPTFSLELPDTEDKKLQADIVSTLARAGFKAFPLWWIREKFGIPEAEEGEPTLADLTPAASPAQRLNNVKQTDKRQLRAFSESPSVEALMRPQQLNVITEASQLLPQPTAADQQPPLDDLKNLVTKNLQNQAEALVGPVLELLRQCNSFEEANGRLAEAFPEMDASGLVQDLSRSMFVSEVWGRLTGAELEKPV